MDMLVAYCGLVCSDCPAYIATLAADDAAIEAVAAQWRTDYNAPHITADSVICDGCLTTVGRKAGYCAECQIRSCALSRNLANCADCSDYACDRLEQFFYQVPDARATLEAIRAA